MDKVLEKVDKILKPKQSIQFEISKEKTDIYDNKLGGIPYLPKNVKYPTSKTSNLPLFLLAQINFETLPHIKPFPKTGILQIYIAPDDLYGMNLNKLTSQNNFRILYHDTIIKDRTQLTEEFPTFTKGDYDMLPFSREYKLIPVEQTIMYADAYTEETQNVYVDEYNDLYTPNIKSLFDLDDEVAEQLFERNERKNAFIGGYPYFTQDDPRNHKSLSDLDIVLFELISQYDKKKGIDIMWGDSGTGTFLISKQNLKNLDFSKVAFNYDCY